MEVFQQINSSDGVIVWLSQEFWRIFWADHHHHSCCCCNNFIPSCEDESMTGLIVVIEREGGFSFFL